MNRPTRFLAALAALSVVGMAACDSPTATNPAIGAPSRTITVQPDLGTEIRSLVTAGFPKGQATSILAKWDQVLKAVAKEPKMVLKGKTVPGTSGRAELARTISYIQLKQGEAIAPAGEKQAHFVARIVLDMSLYVYGGPSAQPPPLTATSDVAYGVVQPADTATVVTPAAQAAVAFPAGAVSEPTVVVITPIDTYYPDNCSGPLVTHLCQYPRFYHFNVFPDVKLNIAAMVQVCHIDAGTARMPLANHDRFLITHERPADSADYTPGAIQVDGIEMLPLVTMNVTKCAEGKGTSYTVSSAAGMSPMQRLASLAGRFVSRASSVALKALLPKDAYAIDVGGGGSVLEFSIFGVVDPDSKPDLAQSPATATRFHASAATVDAGSTMSIAPWNVTNLGSGTSGAFTSAVIVADDSALTKRPATTVIGGAASLVPGATFTYAAQTLTMPTTPGTYFVGTRLTYAGTDSTPSDDWTSTRVEVLTPTIQSAASAASWTAAGPGTTTTQLFPDHVLLNYDDRPSGYSNQTFTFTTTAAGTGNYSFNWKYDGLHSWYRSHQALEAFADGPNGQIVVTLVPLSYLNTGNGFGYSGTATLPLVAGYAWGVRASGGHYDSSQILLGTVQIMDIPPLTP